MYILQDKSEQGECKESAKERVFHVFVTNWSSKFIDLFKAINIHDDFEKLCPKITGD